MIEKTANVRRCPCQGGTLVRFLQPIILAILSEGPAHGYAIMQQVSSTRLWKAEKPDPAGFYRTLKGMEQRGLISSVEDSQERRLYSLTQEGRDCREMWLKTLRGYRFGLNEVIALLDKAVEE